MGLKAIVNIKSDQKYAVSRPPKSNIIENGTDG